MYLYTNKYFLLNNNLPALANNLTTEEPGIALDARQGKILNDKMLKTFAVTVNTDSGGNAAIGQRIYDILCVSSLTKHIYINKVWLNEYDIWCINIGVSDGGTLIRSVDLIVCTL